VLNAADVGAQETLVSGTNIKTINGASLLGAGDIALSTAAVRTPTNSSPADAATNVAGAPALTGSPYYSLYGVAMAAGQWQVSTVSDFATTVVDTGDVAGTAVAHTVSAGVLSVSTVYYWRVRYKDAEGAYSAWSAGTSFTTKANFNYIDTPAATPAAFGAAFEGGFYTGMAWNELVQTTTSTLIGTGSKVFTVADMVTTPIVYVGQTLEVRSRANPVNKMIGAVTGAVGTSLTINVTSVGGSGTFTDWSVMSRYRIIKAPKSTETNLAYKNSNDAAPAACGTLTEGWKATLAMVAAGDATVYPAAHYCRNLTSGGKTDWYLGARDENELDWRNLKPTADANYVATRAKSAIVYGNLGSYDDGATDGQGVDNNSSPAGVAYTAGVPAQVAAGMNFRTGETEAFAYGSAYYWSASEYSATAAWLQFWGSSYPGTQTFLNKTTAYYVRAVRRSII